MRPLLVVALTLSACGSDDANSDNPAGSQQNVQCGSSADCGDGYVCLAQGGYAACAAICTGAATACSASASCGSVGVMDVDVCQQPAANAEGNQAGNNDQNAPDPEDQPRIPCKTDQECAAVQPGAICAQWHGERDCTIACASESQCDLPTLGGVTMDFMTCIADEGHPSRRACLPDATCLNDVMSCIDLGNFGGF